MKALIKISFILISFIMVAACSTGKANMTKYDFGNELTEATAISNFRIKSWESIDYQSLIIITNINDYYLLILQRPTRSLPFSEDIGITITADRARPGYNNIVVADSAGVESYIIQKMYKLKGRDQAREIKKRLKN